MHDDIQQFWQQQPQLRPIEVAQQLGVSELAVVQSLPREQCAFISGNHLEELLQRLATWGPLTTIVESAGNIFEFKGSLPTPVNARGYLNLIGEQGQLHGHLLASSIATIALISRPWMGKESHHFAFFGAQGEGIFKIYLGRDAQRQLLPPQVAQFKEMQQRGQL